MAKKVKSGLTGEKTKQRCPHCNRQLVFGFDERARRTVFECKSCQCTFKPMGLKISAQEHAIHILRKHLDTLLENLDVYERKLSEPKLTVKKARDLIAELQDKVAPISLRDHCPNCMEQGSVSVNCFYCQGTGYKSNL